MVMLNETPAGNAAEIPVLEARTLEEAETLQRLMKEQQHTQKVYNEPWRGGHHE
ncbi:MAG: hypothetical protein NT140_01110 [Deltaproteobacteria bacterium]|nr:hypothetical protein [Deltaproteobacteria bacterium]